MVVVLASLAAAEPCDELAVSVPLVPVRNHRVARHRELMADVSSGRGASPVYRVPWSRMDAELALQAYGHDRAPMNEADQARYKDLSLVAATMAAERLANEWIDDSEVLSGVRTGARTVVGPNLVVTRQDEGLKLSANERPMHRYPKHTRARLQEPGRPGPRPPTLRLGAGTSLVDRDEEDLSTDIGVAWRAYVLGERFGFDAFRVAVDVADLTPSRRKPVGWSGAWSVQVREGLVGPLSATGELSSLPGAYMPSRARTGLNLQVIPNNRRWLLRTTYTYTLPVETGAEHRGELRLTYNGLWHMPTDVERWPRGQPLDAEPAWFVEVPQSGPTPPRLIASCPDAPLRVAGS